MTIQQNPHKNKTLAALLATFGGAIGLYRFYLAGRQDKWGWLHVASLPLSLCIFLLAKNTHPFFAFAPLILSTLIGFLASLVIGTMSDEKWDANFNPTSSEPSQSDWPLALLLVFTLALGAGSLIAVIARSFDLLFTGGLYG
ncbi:hypothetical protein AAKU67_001090 [Oxalobacteraceae bacterium GrIS 2.11]